MNKSLIIYYFPIGLRYASTLVFLLSVYLIFQLHFVIALLLALAGLCILTAKYVTTINGKRKNIEDYFAILGLKINNEKISYSLLKQIIITKENKGYSANSRSRERQVKWSQYNAFLLYDNDKSFKLVSDNDKIFLIAKLGDIVKALNLKVEDRTTNAPFEVNVEVTIHKEKSTGGGNEA